MMRATIFAAVAQGVSASYDVPFGMDRNVYYGHATNGHSASAEAAPVDFTRGTTPRYQSKPAPLRVTASGVVPVSVPFNPSTGGVNAPVHERFPSGSRASRAASPAFVAQAPIDVKTHAERLYNDPKFQSFVAWFDKFQKMLGVTGLDMHSVYELMTGRLAPYALGAWESHPYAHLANAMHKSRFIKPEARTKNVLNWAEQTKRDFELARAITNAQEKRMTKAAWDQENKDWLNEKKDLENLTAALPALQWAENAQEEEKNAKKSKDPASFIQVPAPVVQISPETCVAALTSVGVTQETAQFIVSDPSKKANDGLYRKPEKFFEDVVVALRKMTAQDLAGFDGRVQYVKNYLTKNGCSPAYADRFVALFGDDGWCCWCCCCTCLIVLMVVLVLTIVLIVMCCCCKKTEEEVTDADL